MRTSKGIGRGNQGTSRRDFIKTAAVATGAAGALGACDSFATSQSTAESEGLRIQMAGYDYDRVEGLRDGRVPIEGCDLSFEVSSVGEMNVHVLSGPQTREVTEIGLHPFMLAYANDGFRGYSLIPVFPLRTFRHKSVFIRTDRGIERPEDLRGKKIATPGYSSTSLTWIRGAFQDEHGLDPGDMEWIITSRASAGGQASKQENILPEDVPITMGPEGQDESDLLVSGDVDALFHAAEPRAYMEGNPIVARLFPDSRATERAYFAKTGIFPIMHAVAIRDDVIEQNPWLPRAVFEAYSKAKQLSYDFLQHSAWYKLSLPWVGQELEETRKLMGDNYWPYGIEPNRKVLETLFRYSHEQGLASRKLTIEELFHPSTLELAEADG
jgi:4,5-dihydroxyphthalate decarboxylase